MRHFSPSELKTIFINLLRNECEKKDGAPSFHFEKQISDLPFVPAMKLEEKINFEFNRGIYREKTGQLWLWLSQQNDDEIELALIVRELLIIIDPNAPIFLGDKKLSYSDIAQQIESYLEIARGNAKFKIQTLHEHKDILSIDFKKIKNALMEALNNELGKDDLKNSSIILGGRGAALISLREKLSLCSASDNNPIGCLQILPLLFNSLHCPLKQNELREIVASATGQNDNYNQYRVEVIRAILNGKELPKKLTPEEIAAKQAELAAEKAQREMRKVERAWLDNNPYNFLNLKKIILVQIETKIQGLATASQEKPLSDENRKIFSTFQKIKTAVSCLGYPELDIEAARNIAQLSFYFVINGGSRSIFISSRKKPLNLDTALNEEQKKQAYFEDFTSAVVTYVTYDKTKAKELLKPPTTHLSQLSLAQRVFSASATPKESHPPQTTRTATNSPV